MNQRTFTTNAGEIRNVSNEDRLFKDQCWLTAHNGWNTGQLGLPNQCKSITELLNYGVRGFALDIRESNKGILYLSHNGLPGSSMDWSIVKDELEKWLAANTREVVTLFFESYLAGPKSPSDHSTPLNRLDDSLKLIACYKSGAQAQKDAIRYYKLKELIDGTTDRPYSQRLFAFLERQPDEGSQSLFPVMTKSISENVYGDSSLRPATWVNLRENSHKSFLDVTFMNHFGNNPTGNEFDRNATPLLVKHANAFAFNFEGRFPNFISLDYINNKTGNVGPVDAIGALQSAKTLAVENLKFAKWNDYEYENIYFDYVDTKSYRIKDTVITGFSIVTDPNEGIVTIEPTWGDKSKNRVSAIEFVSVGGQGIVNMRYKLQNQDWLSWTSDKYPKPGDPGAHSASYDFPVTAIVGTCCYMAKGYGVVDFGAAGFHE